MAGVPFGVTVTTPRTRVPATTPARSPAHPPPLQSNYWNAPSFTLSLVYPVSGPWYWRCLTSSSGCSLGCLRKLCRLYRLPVLPHQGRGTAATGAAVRLSCMHCCADRPLLPAPAHCIPQASGAEQVRQSVHPRLCDGSTFVMGWCRNEATWTAEVLDYCTVRWSYWG